MSFWLCAWQTLSLWNLPWPPIFSAWILTLAIWCLTSQMWWEMLPAQMSKVWLSCPLRIALGLEWDIVPIHVPHSRAQGFKSKVVFDAKHLENQAKEKGELLWPRSLKMEVRRKDKIHCSRSHTAVCLPGSLPIEEETLSVLGLGGGWGEGGALCAALTHLQSCWLSECLPSLSQSIEGNWRNQGVYSLLSLFVSLFIAI